MTKVEIIQKALEDKKATNIEVLDVAEQTSLADYFVVASCQSTVQVRACVDEIEEKLEEAGFEINHKEGYRGGSWILVDCGDVIVTLCSTKCVNFMLSNVFGTMSVT